MVYVLCSMIIVMFIIIISTNHNDDNNDDNTIRVIIIIIIISIVIIVLVLLLLFYLDAGATSGELPPAFSPRPPSLHGMSKGSLCKGSLNFERASGASTNVRL